MASGKLTKLETRRLFKNVAAEWNEYVLTSTIDELNRIANDPASGAYQRVTSKAMIEAIESGNLSVLAWFYDRTHGKPATQVTIDANINHKHEEIKAMPTKDVVKLMNEILPTIEGNDDDEGPEL